MISKQTIKNFLQNSTPRILKNLFSNNYRAWICKQLDYGITFDGWGMKTTHELPWNAGVGNDYFIRASQDVKKQFDFSGDGGVNLSNIDELLWRHWIVSYSVRHVIEFTDKDLDLVECGVCDGLSAYFALSDLRGVGGLGRMHLYDAWAPMRNENLLESEKHLIGDYSNISLQRVKKNLSEFDNVVYHPGYIPESLHVKPSPPEKISYLHIDLNSATPTIAALEFFFPRLMRGGVVLFDDYGWNNHRPTKKSVDQFFADKPGILMPLPTGQAIYYR